MLYLNKSVSPFFYRCCLVRHRLKTLDGVIFMYSFWGDSILRGVVYDGSRYSLGRSAVDMLAEESGIEGCKNFSRFGMTTQKAVPLFKKALPSDLNGNLFLEFGGNDCDFDWKAVSFEPYALHLPKTPLSSFIKNMESMIVWAKNAGKTVYVCSLPPIYAPDYFDFVSRGLSADNILSWLGDVQQIYRYHSRYSRAAENLAKLHDVKLVNIREEFLSRGDYSSYMCVDGIHPSEKGQRLIWDALKDAISISAAIKQ